MKRYSPYIKFTPPSPGSYGPGFTDAAMTPDPGGEWFHISDVLPLLSKPEQAVKRLRSKKRRR